MATKTETMDELLAGAEVSGGFGVGDVVEGTVIASDKHEVWLDLGARGTGVVVGREIEHNQDIKPGDTLSASVMEAETDEGYAILSLRKVAKEKGWESLEERFKTGEVFEVTAFDANKGGLLIEVDGIRGFLPVSQLSAEHYPRVSGADKDEILHRLTALVNRPLQVRVLDVNRRETKLIFSEKAARREDTESKVAQMKVGDAVEGDGDGRGRLWHLCERGGDRGPGAHLGDRLGPSGQPSQSREGGREGEGQDHRHRPRQAEPVD